MRPLGSIIVRVVVPLVSCAATMTAARPARAQTRAETPLWMIVVAADADVRVGPWFQAGLSPKVEALGRVSDSLMLGGLADYGVLAMSNATYEPPALGDTSSAGLPSPVWNASGTSHFFHAMGEIRWIRHPWNERGVFWLAGNAGLGGVYTTGNEQCGPSFPPTDGWVVGPALGLQLGADLHVSGPAWFELSGHLTLDRFLGDNDAANYWVEFGVSLGVRFDGPSR